MLEETLQNCNGVGRGNTGELSASVRRARPPASLLHKRGPSFRKMSQNSFFGEEAFAISSSQQICEPIWQLKIVNKISEYYLVVTTDLFLIHSPQIR